MVMAALNEPEQSRTYLKQYASLTKNPAYVERLSRRITDWQRFHKQAGKVQLAQFETAPSDFGGGFGADSSSGFGAGAQSAVGAAPDAAAQGLPAGNPADAQKMVIVDVVIISTEENTTTGKGVNLLNGLTVQFGGTSGGLIFAETKTEADGPNTQTITKRLSIPSITYSLNIANANSSRNEILARPTLIALSGQESNFFSGTAITAAAVGGSGDGATINIEKEIGVKLAVIPAFLGDGRARLKVSAERTFLSTPDTTSISGFTLRIDTTKTTVNANVVMNYGETLILSGLSEKETERRRDGVPGLQDIPVLQYFTSRATSRDFQKSVLVLLTPRPATYVFRDEKQKSESTDRQTEEEKVLSELQARYSDWFRPYPNWASVFHHMQANSLYREFRTGDVTLEKWTNYQTHEDRLRQVLDFLFY
jgi:general secretion pathway protein D